MKRFTFIHFFKRIHSGRIGDFLVNFYATVTGVFLSLICANWISEYNQEKDIHQALSYIKEELTENEATAKKLYKRIRLEKTSMRYLEKYTEKLDSIPSDSLVLYGETALHTMEFTFKYDALESIKMSGLFSKIPNQETAFKISRAYSSTKYLEHLYEKYLLEKSSLKDDLEEIKEIRDLKTFVLGNNWKIFVKYNEGRFYLNKLPRYQASAHYRNNIAIINEAIEILK